MAGSSTKTMGDSTSCVNGAKGLLLDECIIIFFVTDFVQSQIMTLIINAKIGFK